MMEQGVSESIANRERNELESDVIKWQDRVIILERQVQLLQSDNDDVRGENLNLHNEILSLNKVKDTLRDQVQQMDLELAKVKKSKGIQSPKSAKDYFKVTKKDIETQTENAGMSKGEKEYTALMKKYEELVVIKERAGEEIVEMGRRLDRKDEVNGEMVRKIEKLRDSLTYNADTMALLSANNNRLLNNVTQLEAQVKSLKKQIVCRKQDCFGCEYLHQGEAAVKEKVKRNCVYWLRGDCQWGSRCRNFHDPNLAAAGPSREEIPKLTRSDSSASTVQLSGTESQERPRLVSESSEVLMEAKLAKEEAQRIKEREGDKERLSRSQIRRRNRKAKQARSMSRTDSHSDEPNSQSDSGSRSSSVSIGLSSRSASSASESESEGRGWNRGRGGHNGSRGGNVSRRRSRSRSMGNASGQYQGAKAGPGLTAPNMKNKDAMNQEVENIKDVMGGRRQTIRAHVNSVNNAGMQSGIQSPTMPNPNPFPIQSNPPPVRTSSQLNQLVTQKLKEYKDAGVAMEM